MRKREDEPVGAPGEKFCYSDIGYTLLANAVEKGSGVRFEDFPKKRIFEPAGMKDSGIYHTRRDGRPSDRCWKVTATFLRTYRKLPRVM